MTLIVDKGYSGATTKNIAKICQGHLFMMKEVFYSFK
ncbi:hypothetical protein JQM69_05935 [Faecalicatena contorta]|nr:hypothetical protein [Faecalicatena contorta]MCF2680231.1 hypothetical protein [Faecalicatena contorta]